METSVSDGDVDGSSVVNLAILSLDLDIFGGLLATKVIPSSNRQI